MAQNYGNCEFCKAELVKNPRTGKIFCSQKCWLNKQPVPVKPQRQFQPKPDPNWDEITARKEESMIFLNAKNNAAILLAAAIRKGELTLEDAIERYDTLTQKIYEIGKNN